MRFEPSWSGIARRLPKVALAGLALGLATLAGAGAAAALQSRGGSGGSGIASTNTQTASTSTAPTPNTASLSLAKQVGQLIIATYQGQSPPASLLTAIQQGHVGAVILLGDNTARGITATQTATARMQAAARQGGNPGLLIMTDQEGGKVKRLPGPPDYGASAMANPATAYAQGRATGQLLKSAGVNVDLAPVADVIRVNGFIEKEGRSFGSSPAVVSNAACKFAAGLAAVGVAYTLKHFPGLGDAVATTDTQAVSVKESASQLHADGAAYRQCGRGPLALVMISSASYAHLTGSLPAVMDPKIYSQVLPADNVTALPISDSFQSGAINAVANKSPASDVDQRRAGHDHVRRDRVPVALSAYSKLLADARAGTLSRSRVQAASARVLQLKAKLGLVSGTG